MKRVTKAQKEEAAKQRLSEIVHAVYSGATGKKWDGDDFASADTLAGVVPALEDMFGIEGREYMWRGLCLKYFDTAETAAEHLFSNGVRA
jgi:hypothetical protein